MKNEKFTPGPWNTFKENAFRETREIGPEIWDKHGRIATVSIISISTDPEEVLANARLIAQSPTGYALAQAVMEYDSITLKPGDRGLAESIESRRIIYDKMLTLARQFLTAVDGKETQNDPQ